MHDALIIAGNGAQKVCSCIYAWPLNLIDMVYSYSWHVMENKDNVNFLNEKSFRNYCKSRARDVNVLFVLLCAIFAI